MSIHIADIPLCRHTKTDGLRCKSPAVSTSAFCYHHRKLHPGAARRRPRAIAMLPHPPLDTPQSIQRSLSLVLNGLTLGRLDTRTAGQMIRALQLASSSINRQQNQ